MKTVNSALHFAGDFQRPLLSKWKGKVRVRHYFFDFLSELVFGEGRGKKAKR